LVCIVAVDMLCAMTGKNSRHAMQTIETLEPRRMLSVSGLPIRIGSTGFDTGKRIAATSDGGYIEAGLFSGTVNFATGKSTFNLTSLGNSDVFVAKYSANSTLIWVDQFGGTGLKNKLDNQNDIDIAADPTRAGGNFVNGVSSDPSLVGEYVNDLVVAPDGSVYFIGNFLSTVNFQGKTFSTNTSFYDAYIIKLNSAGKMTWGEQFGGQFTDTANGIVLDPSGNVYVTGLFTRTVSFVAGNPKFTLNADGRADGYVMMLNPGGTLKWIDQFGGDATGASDRDAGLDLALDTHGNVYVVGTIAGTSFFTSQTGSSTVLNGDTHAGTDGFVAKYTSTGTLVRVVGFSGRDYEAVNGIAINSNNDIVITGYFTDDVFDADPSPGESHDMTLTPPEFGNARLPDLFVEDLSTNLRLQWADQVEGSGNEFADQVAFDNEGNIVIGGSFYATATFGPHGPTITSVPNTQSFNDANDSDRENSYDPYLWKIEPNGKTDWVRFFGAAQDDFGAGVAILPDDSILFTGRFKGTVNFNTIAAHPRLTGQGLGDVFVTGFDRNGVPLFA
jgi:hypothetical protein